MRPISPTAAFPPTASVWLSGLAVVAGCLAGCAAPARPNAPPETAVAYRAIDAADTPHYALSEDEGATIPTATVTPLPEYPASLVASGISHVAVRAQVIVDATGDVGEVRIAPAASAYPPEFDAAVRVAVAHWHYLPLRIQRWEDVLDDQGNVVDARLSEDEARPFSLEYEFSFDLHDGEPVVAASRAGGQ